MFDRRKKNKVWGSGFDKAECYWKYKKNIITLKDRTILKSNENQKMWYFTSSRTFLVCDECHESLSKFMSGFDTTLEKTKHEKRVVFFFTLGYQLNKHFINTVSENKPPPRIYDLYQPNCINKFCSIVSVLMIL